MKIYIYPNVTHAGVELVAVTEHDSIVAIRRDYPEPQHDAVRGFADFIHRTVPDVTLAWVADPHAHPELAAIIDRLSTEPDDTPAAPAEGESLCFNCAHSEVCAVPHVATPLGALITTCDHHIAIS